MNYIDLTGYGASRCLRINIHPVPSKTGDRGGNAQPPSTQKKHHLIHTSNIFKAVLMFIVLMITIGPVLFWLWISLHVCFMYIIFVCVVHVMRLITVKWEKIYKHLMNGTAIEIEGEMVWKKTFWDWRWDREIMSLPQVNSVYSNVSHDWLSKLSIILVPIVSTYLERIISSGAPAGMHSNRVLLVIPVKKLQCNTTQYVREDWEACSWLGSCSSVVRALAAQASDLGSISSNSCLFFLPY